MCKQHTTSPHSLPCVYVVRAGIYVDDLQKSVDRFTSLGIQFKKRPEEGSMRHIAFIYDPDKYWVEVIAKGKN